VAYGSDLIDDPREISEVLRRGVHASGSVVPISHALAPSIVTWQYVQAILVVGLVVALALETVRLRVGLDWRIFEYLTRSYEQDNLAGYALYMIGMVVVAVAFPPSIAIPGMLMLAIGDPISGLLATNELRNVKRTWVLLAMFGVSTLLAAPFVPPIPAIMGGIAATIADGAKPVVAGYVVDDNLTIAPAASLAIAIGVHYGPALPV
jgi:dolichol kinase